MKKWAAEDNFESGQGQSDVMHYVSDTYFLLGLSRLNTAKMCMLNWYDRPKALLRKT